MKKELVIEIREIVGAEKTVVAEAIVKNDRPNIVSEAIKYIKAHRSLKKYRTIDIYISNGYIESYSGSYYPEFSGTDKEFGSSDFYHVEKTESGFNLVPPCRYCSTGEQVR